MIEMRTFLAVLCLFLSAVSADGEMLTTAVDVAAFLRTRPTNSQVEFVLTGRVNRVKAGRKIGYYGLLLEDRSGIVDVCVVHGRPPSAGDRVAVAGVACVHPGREPWFTKVSLSVLGHGTPPEPLAVQLRDLTPEQHNLRLVEVRGTVVDICRDEIDVRFDRMLLKVEDAFLPVSLPHLPDGDRLLDAEVSVRGIYTRNTNGFRKYSGPQIEMDGTTPVSVVRRLENPFDCPELESAIYETPRELLKRGLRRASGLVIAAWQGDRFFLRTDKGQLILVHLAARGRLPQVGDRVTVAGYPETDSFQIHLTKARFRTEDGRTAPPADAKDLTDFFTEASGRRSINAELQGVLRKVRGCIIALPSAISTEPRAELLCEGLRVPVDASACPHALEGLSVGCTVEATGVCLLESSVWKPHDVLPRISGFALILRTPDDIRLLARPSCWTVGRLLALVALLILALAAILVWNRTLRVVAERRGRELLRAQICEVRSTLKTEERTRLAVELHDSLSQTLTGVSMELEAAGRYGRENPDAMLSHHEIAVRALRSCNTELRNSLWDLRNQAIDEPDLNEAIRRTLLPHLKNIRLTVRFNVPRNRLTDSTTHGILRMIREFAVNGIVHGKATEIRVAGSLDRQRLLFSVQDNGTGFDTARIPGVLEGHFGLKGVRDRLNRLGGSLSLQSAIGSGTKATVNIPLQKTAAEEA